MNNQRLNLPKALVVIPLLLSNVGWGTKLYVNSQTAPVNAGKVMGSANALYVLSKGAEVEKIAEEGLYIKVKNSEGKEGYVAKLFVKETKPVNTVTDMNNVAKLGDENIRARASSFQATVSASARGLNAQDRTRTGRDGFVEDYSAVDEMMAFSSGVVEEDVNRFKKAGDLM